uniref:4-hydroxy-3-methylbut-2-enyl diphosphate reductase n=1 Tax=Anthurium amnicola TaxID=1678845 RepID=A0A1D1YLC5_9ARAE
MAIPLQMCRFYGLDAPGGTPSGVRLASHGSSGSSPSGVRRAGAAGVRRIPVRCGGGGSGSPNSAVEADFDAKAFRHNLTRSKNYNRRGFGHKEETLQLMNREYTSVGIPFPWLEDASRVLWFNLP